MSNIITSLQMQKKNKERVNVFLDGKYAFALNLQAAVRLKKGQQLSAAEVVELQAEDDFHKAYDKALRYLSLRPRSEKEVQLYLAGKKLDEELVAAVIARLKELNYLNDETFSQFWTENRQTFRPKGVQALRQELRQKGIDNETINEALSEIDEDAAAWAAIEKKLVHWQSLERTEFEKKLKGFLLRRGFVYEVVNRVWRRATTEIGD